MTFRVARHTNDFDAIKHFYTDVLGLESLGEFQSHDNYDGLFIGKAGLGWHLEFTVSDHTPAHSPDEDDLLVFYLDSVEEFEAAKSRFAAAGIPEESPRNPYWNRWAATYTDPDGFRIVVSIVKENKPK